MTAPHRSRDRQAMLEHDLLGRLGLGSDATPERIEATHDAVVEYLSGAPRSLRGWARTQAAAADEAFALLSDPAALDRAAALGATEPVPVPKGGGAVRAQVPATEPATTTSVPARRSSPRSERRSGAGEAGHATSSEELDALIAEVTPSAHRDEVRSPVRTPADGKPAGGPALLGHGRQRRLVLAAVAVAAVVLAVVIHNWGSGSTMAAIDAGTTPAAVPTLDEAQVSALMARVQADPTDTEALMDLGDAFFQAGDYAVAADWLAKLVAIDPTDTRALLALGASDFNAGDAAEAEQYWLEVVNLDPGNVEAHYDLGFLYLQQQPPDYEGMQREWRQVVDLAPGTDVAQSVQAHLDALASMSPSVGASPAPEATGVAASPEATGAAASPEATAQP
jgi:tetratricopeptide (TPR) repeat protein